MEKENQSHGAICGGVISSSQHNKNVEEFGVWADTMSWVMEDEWFEKYVAAEKAKDEKTAKKLFKKYAISQI